jgi:hypothetical protein
LAKKFWVIKSTAGAEKKDLPDVNVIKNSFVVEKKYIFPLLDFSSPNQSAFNVTKFCH